MYFQLLTHMRWLINSIQVIIPWKYPFWWVIIVYICGNIYIYVYLDQLWYTFYSPCLFQSSAIETLLWTERNIHPISPSRPRIGANLCTPKRNAWLDWWILSQHKKLWEPQTSLSCNMTGNTYKLNKWV